MEYRIGKLPDDVLGVIISHLTLEEAGRTSVLSRRCKNSWTLTTRLNFDANNRSRLEREKYITWVNQVVENYRASDVDEFSVVCNLDPRSYRSLDKWICFAVTKRVKAININLRLRSERYSFIKSAPDLCGIECLTSLRLKYVDITGEMIESLLSICPLLEKLSLECSKQLSNLKVAGSSLKLKCFQIVDCYDLESIEIYAPNLVSFHYYGWKLGLQVQDLSCLVNLSIGSGQCSMDLYSSRFQATFSSWKLLHWISLATGFLESVGLTQSTNLKDLTLEVRQNAQYTLRVLSQFINLCPLLHKLTLKLLRCSSYVRPGEMIKGNQCPHQCLKVVEIIGFYGRSDQIEIAMFILENAIRLEKFIINLSWCPDQSLIYESQRQAEQLRTVVPPGVELLIFEGFKN